jgi:hypothetical protein
MKLFARLLLFSTLAVSSVFAAVNIRVPVKDLDGNPATGSVVTKAS